MKTSTILVVVTLLAVIAAFIYVMYYYKPKQVNDSDIQAGKETKDYQDVLARIKGGPKCKGCR